MDLRRGMKEVVASGHALLGLQVPRERREKGKREREREREQVTSHALLGLEVLTTPSWPPLQGYLAHKKLPSPRTTVGPQALP